VYNPRGWAGDLTANPIDINTAAVGALPNWSAAGVLAARDWNTRIVFTSSGALGVDFTAGTVGALVNPDPVAFTNQGVVDYLRGNRTGEGDTVRARSSLLGAVVNAEPVLARDERMVYLASGDGMLHAFDTVTGAEQWAYAPPDILANMGRSARRGWIFQTLLDATPSYARLSNGNKLLVGGLGAAGRSYFALDVTSPRGLTAAQAQAQFKWTFPATTDTTNRGNMGFTTGKPVIARALVSGAVTNVVLVTSGYANGQTVGDTRGRLWMLNADTGEVIRTYRTSAGTVGAETGLSAVSGLREPDGTVRYAYGGDLLGNLWRFDLARTGTGELDAELLATLRDADGNAQPVTAKPDLVRLNGQRVVLVGTGRLLDSSDFGSTRVQSFYAISDPDTLSTLTNARNTLVQQTHTRGTSTMSANTVNWATNRGWYLDLSAGEQANTDPTVAYGAVTFVTNISSGASCAQSSFMYLVDIGTGTRAVGADFVSQTLSTTANASRMIIVNTNGGQNASVGNSGGPAGSAGCPGGVRPVGIAHLSDGTIATRCPPPPAAILPAKNAWKEVRR
jgi:type IV pilus assembly protein PilY1